MESFVREENSFKLFYIRLHIVNIPYSHVWYNHRDQSYCSTLVCDPLWWSRDVMHGCQEMLLPVSWHTIRTKLVIRTSQPLKLFENNVQPSQNQMTARWTGCLLWRFYRLLPVRKNVIQYNVMMKRMALAFVIWQSAEKVRNYVLILGGKIRQLRGI